MIRLLSGVVIGYFVIGLLIWSRSFISSKIRSYGNNQIREFCHNLSVCMQGPDMYLVRVCAVRLSLIIFNLLLSCK